MDSFSATLLSLPQTGHSGSMDPQANLEILWVPFSPGAIKHAKNMEWNVMMLAYCEYMLCICE